MGHTVPNRLNVLRALALERPDDDAAHLVYADALMEEGDPLGHLIAAQIRTPSAPVPDDVLRRIAGPLRRFGRLEVRRGFLREVHMRRMTPTEYDRVIGHPAWDTVQVVGFARSKRVPSLPAARVVALLSHAVCRNVHRVEGVDRGTFLALTRLPLGLTSMAIDVGSLSPRDVVGDALPLRSLEMEVYSPLLLGQWFASAGRPVLDTLEELRVDTLPWFELEVLQHAPARLQRLVGPRSESVRRDGRWHLTLEPLAPNADRIGPMLREAEDALERHASLFASITLRVPDIGSLAIERFVRLANGVPVTVEPVVARGAGKMI